MPFLATIETLPGPYHYGQEEVIAAVVDWLQKTHPSVDPRAVSRLFERAGVSERASLRPLEEVFSDATFAERNAIYRNAMIETGVRLGRAALEGSGLPTVDLIISSSCTGFMIPAVDAHVANALSLGPRLARLPITEAGCAGGAVALARAGDFLIAHPKSACLIVAIEFSSLTFQAKDPSPTNLVATALFADGASAAVLLGKDHPAAAGAEMELITTASYFLPDSLGAMGYDVVESGLKLVLDKRLPDFLRGQLRPMAAEFLAENGRDLSSVTAFAVHAGGRKVLDVAEEELGLAPGQLEASRSVLRDHGNMSSATILFVMKRAFAALAPGHLVLGVGFGPGFSVEFSLWRRI